MQIEQTDENYVTFMVDYGKTCVDRALALLRAHQPSKKILQINEDVQGLLREDIKRDFTKVAALMDGFEDFVSTFNAMAPDKQNDLAQQALEKIIQKTPNTFISKVANTPA